MVFKKELSSSSSSSSSNLLLPRENTPLLKQNQHLSSQSKTFANVFIAIVGAGVLGLPYAFKKTGWLLGLSVLFTVSALTYHCMMLLVYTRRKLEKRYGYVEIASFGDLGHAVCGSLGRFAVDVMLVLAQAGFCVSYLIFVSNTLAFLINKDDGSDASSSILGLSPKSFYLWSCFPFQLGLNSIPSLTHLAPLSIFADVVDLGAMGIVMAEDAMIYVKERPALQPLGSWSIIFYGIGVAVYAFEGIGMVLPLESETRDKRKFGKVLGLCMVFISSLYGAFGVLGYMAFGEDTKDIITTNFGQGIISMLVQIGLCINLFFSFPLMMNPVYEVAERRLCDSRYCVWLRWLMVLVVSLVALLVPNFSDFLSLVGSSVCCILGFVLPSLFHLIVFKEELGWHGLMLDWTILVLGLVVAVSGTYSSLMEILAPKA